MSSSSDFTTGPAAPVAAEATSTDDSAEGGETTLPEEVKNDEPESVKVEGSLAELHRETAAMLRTLADRYDAEAVDKRALAARLRAETEANETLASQLAEESARIRVDADRLGTQPTWIGATPAGDDSSSAATDAAPAESPDDASPAGDQAARVRSESAWSSESERPVQSDQAAQSGQESESGQAAQSFSSVESVPGPGPARGYAVSPDQVGEESTSAESGAPSAEPPGAPEDWAPRPFESWRNQTSRVIPRLLGL